MSFEDFIREAQARAAAPKPPTLAERLRALNREDSRRDKIEALAEHGATEGERAAATAAMRRLEHPSTQAHDLTERGSYYARDTLAGSTDE